MYCQKCGKEIHDEAVICPHCGCATGVNSPIPSPSAVDSGSIGWGFLGFFFPLIGLILYLVWKDNKPFSSKMAGKGALIGVIVEVVLYFFILFIVGFIMGLTGTAPY